MDPRQKAYKTLMYGARARGILWDLSFEDWWLLWSESGKWPLRGRRSGDYILARKEGKGSFTAQNVEIVKINRRASREMSSLLKVVRSKERVRKALPRADLSSVRRKRYV